jgi:hypothetical protein
LREKSSAEVEVNWAGRGANFRIGSAETEISHPVSKSFKLSDVTPNAEAKAASVSVSSFEYLVRNQ